MKTPKVVVTGAAGYIGSRVTADLIHESYEVIPVDDFSNSDLRSVEGVDIQTVDITNPYTVPEADVVVHLAAIPGIEACRNNPHRALEVNVEGTRNVVAKCEADDSALVFASTVAVADGQDKAVAADTPPFPLTYYGAMKAVCEELVDRAAIPTRVIRKTNIYGSHQIAEGTVTKSTLINYFIEQARDGNPLTVYSPGTQARDYLHVEDASKGYVSAVSEVLEAHPDSVESAHRLLAGEDELDVLEVAHRVQRAAVESKTSEPPITFKENPRDESLADTFPVEMDGSGDFDWAPTTNVEREILDAFFTEEVNHDP